MDNKSPHNWIANGGRGGEPRFSMDKRIADVPLMHVCCNDCGIQARFTRKQWDDYNKNAASTVPGGK